MMCQLADFYPRSPCGERLVLAAQLMFSLYFYPRSPCGERRSRGRTSPSRKRFLSTLSLRRATFLWCSARAYIPISIHALLAESDSLLALLICPPPDFYPRSPCGERPAFWKLLAMHILISIHALLAESDGWARSAGGWATYFYPRSPCGERPRARVIIRAV